MKLSKLASQRVKNYYHLADSHISNLLFGRPAQKLKIIGVTGTDGKTTTSNLLYAIFTAAQKKVGLVSSINAKLGKSEMPLKFHVTTPDPRDLMKILASMVKNEIEYVVLETTSHALDQKRVGAITYIGCAFTNITREHLDYHRTFEEYRLAKARLLDQTVAGGIAVLNADDPSFDFLQKRAKRRSLKVLSYGVALPADFTAHGIAYEDGAQTFELRGPEGLRKNVTLYLPGLYNVANALAAAALAYGLGIPADAIVEGLGQVKRLKGRWEILQAMPYTIVVDFAHTPNALKSALEVARNTATKSGNVHVVFGCAGRRDFTKRPVMGKIAGELADFVYITAEDPRDEDVNEINRAIESGTLEAGRTRDTDYFLLPDRKEAIIKALKSAQPGDVVLITGKGHEVSMNLDGKTEIPWSDQQIIQDYLHS